jgi:hypothetical protein
MAHTDADGEIIVLDSAGYGRVTIDRSVSIIAPAEVYAGISVQTGETFITDSTIRDNNGFGVHAESALNLTIDATRIELNGSSGLRVRNGPFVTVGSSLVVGNSVTSGFGGIDIESDDGASETFVTVTGSNISQNRSHGIRATANADGSIVRVSAVRNTISANASTGITVGASTGALNAVITGNAIVRSSGRRNRGGGQRHASDHRRQRGVVDRIRRRQAVIGRAAADARRQRGPGQHDRCVRCADRH